MSSIFVAPEEARFDEGGWILDERENSRFPLMADIPPGRCACLFSASPSGERGER